MKKQNYGRIFAVINAYTYRIDEIEQKVKEIGVDAEFHKIPEAMEYRETIAILEKLKSQGEHKTIDEIIAEEFPASLMN